MLEIYGQGGPEVESEAQSIWKEDTVSKATKDRKGTLPVIEFYRTRKRVRGGKYRMEWSWRLLASHNRKIEATPGESFPRIRSAMDNLLRVQRDMRRATVRMPATQ